MADKPVVHIGENSPEEIAYRLFGHITVCEQKNVTTTAANNPDRKWILDTYAECLRAVRSPRARLIQPSED
jgi:hypothetical protein